jgi:hypothetical protein
VVNSNTVDLVVNAATVTVSSIAITVSPNPATLSQTVDITATVTGSNGGVLSGTTVYLFVDGALTGSGVATNSSGVATFSITPASTGTYTIYVSSDTSGT